MKYVWPEQLLQKQLIRALRKCKFRFDRLRVDSKSFLVGYSFETREVVVRLTINLKHPITAWVAVCSPSGIAVRYLQPHRGKGAHAAVKSWLGTTIDDLHALAVSEAIRSGAGDMDER